MNIGYETYVSGVDLPMLQFWLEREFLQVVFRAVLPPDYPDIPDLPVTIRRESARWYLANDEWEGYGLVSEPWAPEADRYEWGILFVNRCVTTTDIAELEKAVFGQIRLEQRRQGEVHIWFSEKHSGGPLFSDILIDWLWELYGCQVEEMPSLESIMAEAERKESVAEPTDVLGLSPAELEIAHCYAAGKTAAEIARERVTGVKTVQAQVDSIKGKLRLYQDIPDEYRFRPNEVKTRLRTLGYGQGFT